MHRLVASVFKILFISIMMMFLLDTTLVLVQILDINSKVNNIASVMQMEVAKNNCMPKDMADGFTEYLARINSGTTIISGLGGETNQATLDEITKNIRSNSGDIKTNFYSDLKMQNYRYLDEDGRQEDTVYKITEEAAKDYGEFTMMAIEITLHPMYVYLGNGQTSTIRKVQRDVPMVMNYVYYVPCLRYLK